MKENRFYHWAYPIFWLIITVFFWPIVKGRENIPSQGGFIVYANHTSNSDPVFMVYAMGRDNKTHIMAKKSLFAVPILGGLLRALKMISVDRSINDINAVKESLSYLKNGEILGIFPEGTRIRDGEASEAKRGVARLAEKTKVPVLPMFITPGRLLFNRKKVIIGKPYYINPEKKKLAATDYASIAEEMMELVRNLEKETDN